MKFEAEWLYYMNDARSFALAPMNIWASFARQAVNNPFVPTTIGDSARKMGAGLEMMERFTRRFGKPAWGVDSVKMEDGTEVKITPKVVESRPFCDLLHFEKHLQRSEDKKKLKNQPRVLLVAPMSGHYATLLRGTVQAFLPNNDVYITDWKNCRDIPLAVGTFTLDDYIDYLMAFFHELGPNLHIVAVCQPSVPVLATVSIMAALKDHHQPFSMTLMGGPIDTRENPTKANVSACERPLWWFEENIIASVPFYYPGFMRRVCPGFLMLTGFMSLNMDRHMDAHAGLYQHLIKGDDESATASKKFYDEYLSVMDLPAEYFLESMRTSFQEHLLPKGHMMWRSHAVRPQLIKDTALMTVEGELDDISGVGQTKAAHILCSGIHPGKHKHHL
ncbi:Putative intracellular PHB depolymerase [Candidatus Bealeia paramacronuclearis]|uniref:Intracellular PHB depolymerase n=1 Tax=Candidatus Bealeia paramacronuclearis TaxID=1921001 RepID=A0ABZ2C0Y7_9PROT|nr:putative intracellular PHB depolymerase [Candidatus Bealeia paramacronuclearis]